MNHVAMHNFRHKTKIPTAGASMPRCQKLLALRTKV